MLAFEKRILYTRTLYNKVTLYKSDYSQIARNYVYTLKHFIWFQNIADGRIGYLCPHDYQLLINVIHFLKILY